MAKRYVFNREDAEVTTVSDGKINRDVLVLHENENMVSGITVIHPHGQTRGHSHPEREEHYFVLTGKGFVQLDDERYPIRAGDGISVPPISVHTIINPNDEPLEFFWAAFTDEPKVKP